MLVRLSKHALQAGVLALPALLFFASANAQSTRERFDNLESQITRLDRLVQNSQTTQTNMLQRLNELQNENQQLRNQLETLQFESSRGGERERELYMDLDKRLQTLESAGPVAATGGAAAGAGGSDEQDYQAAFGMLREGRYLEASDAFNRFLTNYPNSALRDNAQYWLAETDYVTKKFPAALEGFQKVITEYPQSRKLPDAWLKVGYCNFELARWGDARQALSTAARLYPETTSGKLAQERLAKMDANGL